MLLFYDKIPFFVLLQEEFSSESNISFMFLLICCCFTGLDKFNQ